MTTAYRPFLVCPSCETPHRVVCEAGAWRFVRHTRTVGECRRTETCPAATVTVDDVLAATEHDRMEAYANTHRAETAVEVAKANLERVVRETSDRHASIFRFVAKLKR